MCTSADAVKNFVAAFKRWEVEASAGDHTPVVHVDVLDDKRLQQGSIDLTQRQVDQLAVELTGDEAPPGPAAGYLADVLSHFCGSLSGAAAAAIVVFTDLPTNSEKPTGIDVGVRAHQVSACAQFLNEQLDDLHKSRELLSHAPYFEGQPVRIQYGGRFQTGVIANIVVLSGTLVTEPDEIAFGYKVRLNTPDEHVVPANAADIEPIEPAADS